MSDFIVLVARTQCARYRSCVSVGSPTAPALSHPLLAYRIGQELGTRSLWRWCRSGFAATPALNASPAHTSMPCLRQAQPSSLRECRSITVADTATARTFGTSRPTPTPGRLRSPLASCARQPVHAMNRRAQEVCGRDPSEQPRMPLSRMIRSHGACPLPHPFAQRLCPRTA